VRLSLRLYLLAMAAPAATVALLLLRLPSHTQADPVLAGVLVGLGAIAANFPVMVTKSSSVKARSACAVTPPPDGGGASQSTSSSTQAS